MTLETFLIAPWKESHPLYRTMSIGITPAPEFATAEALLASTYRAVGFSGHAETDVPEWGRKLDRAAANKRRFPGTQIEQETWRTILHSALESPKQPKQSARRFLQLCPVVPEACLYSGSARPTAKSWDPGALIRRMIRVGSPSLPQAEEVWTNLFESLSVTGADDIWARWLQGEFSLRRLPAVEWAQSSISEEQGFPDSDKDGMRYPAHTAVRDLNAVLAAKPAMTRRQWVSLVEAVLRIGAVSHVLWLCEVNHRLWLECHSVLTGGSVPDEQALKDAVFSAAKPALGYGTPALPTIRRIVSGYLMSRIGVNLLLWALPDDEPNGSPLSGVRDYRRLLSRIKRDRTRLTAAHFDEMLNSLYDSETRVINCRKGIGSNMIEFCRHALGQRQTADESLRGYDQGYELRKRGTHSSAPWVVSLGPVALLALVHACLSEVDGPRSIQRFCEHLEKYGIRVSQDDLQRSDLGHNLRMLGLVLDSPDAESGMLLVPPFDLQAEQLGVSND